MEKRQDWEKGECNDNDKRRDDKNREIWGRKRRNSVLTWRMIMEKY